MSGRPDGPRPGEIWKDYIERVSRAYAPYMIRIPEPPPKPKRKRKKKAT